MIATLLKPKSAKRNSCLATHRSKDLDSTLVCSAALFPRRPDTVRVMDFFGSVPRVAPSDAAAALNPEPAAAPAATARAGSLTGSGGGANGMRQHSALVCDAGRAASAAGAAAATAEAAGCSDGSFRANPPSAGSPAADSTPASQPQQHQAAAPFQQQRAPGFAARWAAQQEAGADVPLLVGAAAAATAAVLASRWSRSQHDLISGLFELSGR